MKKKARKPPHHTRNAQAEAALLSETRMFMRVAARLLTALAGQSRTLRRRLTRTESYQRIYGTDAAESEPTFSLAGTLGQMFEDDLDSMTRYLRSAAQSTSSARRLPGRQR